MGSRIFTVVCVATASPLTTAMEGVFLCRNPQVDFLLAIAVFEGQSGIAPEGFHRDQGRLRQELTIIVAICLCLHMHVLLAATIHMVVAVP